MEHIASQKKIAALLSKHGFNIKKSFGQNFLIDKNILTKIVTTAGITKETIALEIGPGVGSLTQFLGDVAKTVYCFEIDHKLESLLAETLESYDNIHVIYKDFLKEDLVSWYKTIGDEPIHVVANLPYYITTPILEKLIIWFAEQKPNLSSATVMMQKEVAQRLNAAPNSKEYGSLSIFIQLFTDVKLAFTVPKTVFIPAPNVDSAIVKLTFKESTLFSSYEESQVFMTFVRLCFATRRKTLVNNLKGHYESQSVLARLEQLEIDHRVRAEQLTVEQFLAIHQIISEKSSLNIGE
ncbi:MAG: 16S rRNA (adenine(1518)-N(6)/adenine(1519)-N(6))-dimethyltransferase RsmA [Culicoidibacterales bacterium]